MIFASQTSRRFTPAAFLFYRGCMLILLRVPNPIDDDDASDELDELCDYIKNRLRTGVEERRVLQSLVEAVLAFDGEGVEMQSHVLH